MHVLHKDFAACAAERAALLERSSRLFAVASALFCASETANVAAGVVRPLYATEIRLLQTICRCRSNDWSKIRLLLPQKNHDIDQSERLAHLVSDTAFHGVVVLVLLGSAPPPQAETEAWVDEISAGIHGCAVIANCMIHIDTARVHRCGVIAKTYIDAHSIVWNCGRVTCSGAVFQRLFAKVGPESGGGRLLQLLPEATMMDAGDQLRLPRAVPTEQTTTTRASFNVIGSQCVVRDTPTLDTVFLHPGSLIEAASSVQRAILFPASAIRNACTVKNAILQWNCSIIDQSNVADALLMEQAVAGPSSVVTNTILGPDVHVSAGEVHASVLGPNCNAHHQSLLIAVLWPGGRGNVGYGANVGSNHTGRLPDQECTAGEGTFWGLSCVIKFPVDLSSAPYSVVAAGTNMAPQRCTMPFSLIVGDNGRSGSRIIPGWVLRSSPYTIVRSEHKFATRRKAVRHSSYTGWKILRPETVELCIAARRALQSTAGADTAGISGVGASELTEKDRVAGIQAYTECIQQFALQGLYSFLVASKSTKVGALEDALAREFSNPLTPMKVQSGDDVCWPIYPWDADQSPEAFWRTQRAILIKEFPMGKGLVAWARDLLKQLIVLETAYAKAVYICKQRDDARGAATIPHYEVGHVLADRDPVLTALRMELENKKATVVTLLQELDGARQSKL